MNAARSTSRCDADMALLPEQRFRPFLQSPFQESPIRHSFPRLFDVPRSEARRCRPGPAMERDACPKITRVQKIIPEGEGGIRGLCKRSARSSRRGPIQAGGLRLPKTMFFRSSPRGGGGKGHSAAISSRIRHGTCSSSSMPPGLGGAEWDCRSWQSRSICRSPLSRAGSLRLLNGAGS